MGCNLGKHKGRKERSSTTQSFDSRAATRKQERLLDKYQLGNVVGQGAFGVVYSCKQKGTNEEFAVKMVDQVETPLADIKQELAFLQRLAHPLVVKLRDVYYEKVFICIVMDLYHGGDMIEGMQLHWSTKGMISIPVCQNAAKMMFGGIEWLHRNSVVHRDLKGDNYLLNIKQLDDPQCRIFLSDFGTVTECVPGKNFSKRVGTNTYWSPEFYDLDYNMEVDVWALGVVMYGMITGRFPFKGEDDCRSKVVQQPSRLDSTGWELLMRTLDRNRQTRIKSSEALQHAWLAEIALVHGEELEKLDPGFKAEVKESGANAGIKERRRELVQRLEDAQEKAGGADAKSTWEKLTKDFELIDARTGRRDMYAWWSPAQVAEANFYDKETVVTLKDDDAELNAKASEEGIRQMLQSHNIDTSKFGQDKAKSVFEFVREVQSGSARLMLDASKHKKVVRVVDVVLLRVVHGQGINKKYLLKTSEQYPDGRVRGGIYQLAGNKKLPHENGRRCVDRLVKQRIPTLDGKLDIDFLTTECFEDDEESPSYPGVRTVYRKEIYEAVVKETAPTELQKMGLGASGSCKFAERDDMNYTRFFEWLNEKECVDKKVKLRAPAGGSEVSALVEPPIGYEENELQEFLKANNVDVSQFGKGDVKSLAAFSEELVQGEATLQKQPDGTLIRVVDVVILEIFGNAGNTLVEVGVVLGDGVRRERNRLPAVKRRADENPFWAAHRVLHKVLKISENHVEFDEKNVAFVEQQTDSKAYAGLPTLYRKRIIPAKVTLSAPEGEPQASA